MPRDRSYEARRAARVERRGVKFHPTSLQAQPVPADPEPDYQPEPVDIVTLCCTREATGDLEFHVAPADWLAALEPAAYLGMLISAEAALSSEIAGLRAILKAQDEGEADE